MKQEKIYDIIGIGVGPFNLSLACLAQPVKELDTLFFDRAQEFNWHPGMMMQDTTLQIPFLADLVTLADPTSEFSFLNYIKEKGRIYSFYIRENFYLLRKEYNQYCQWAIEKLSNLRFNHDVKDILYDEEQGNYLIKVHNNNSETTESYRAERIVLGTGTSPYTPPFFAPLKNKVSHSSEYLYKKKELQSEKTITIIGSGQSAAEIYYDLLQDIDVYGYELNWITRSSHFFQMEYNKLTLELTSPEYVDYFYGLPAEKRRELLKKQNSLYKGINESLINDIFDLLYTKRLTCDFKTNLLTNSECVGAKYSDGKIDLEFYHTEQEENFNFHTDALLLCTGYKYMLPEFLLGIKERINWKNPNKFDVQRNYSIDKNGGEIFVQNAELESHGFVTPDLGMVCYRNSYILREVTGKDIYPIEERIAFQKFGAYENLITSPQYETSTK
ncbi:lysine N(6)-hydroxylase/L-ornithine N(5)-oxygenase family protein [Chryseobacterium sp. CT-SW4]|uniref:lysine N(6)-hydroxylase/L-ornithine N(5)-oxygenase family protein n=1 Tax=Chryseobacterium sp. SW-1 TaxID=3157343 RepID=UPI003B02E11C